MAAESALFHVEHDDDALPADLLGHLGNEARPFDRGRADRNLFYAQTHDALGLLDRRHAAAVTQRHATFGGKIGDHRVIGFGTVRSRVDVRDNQFVDLFLVEDAHCIDRVTDIFVVAEFACFDEAAVAHKQAGNDAGAQHILKARRNS